MDGEDNQHVVVLAVLDLQGQRRYHYMYPTTLLTKNIFDSLASQRLWN